MCHPTRVISTMFWDAVNFAKGANPPRAEWKPAPQQQPSTIPIMQRNYRRLCDYLRGDTRLEIAGWSELIRRYDGQRAFATQEELIEIAHRIVSERQVMFTDHFTAGEILLMMCQAAAGARPRYVRPSVYGPLTVPPAGSADNLAAAAVKAAAAAVLAHAGSGYLLAAVTVGDREIGIGAYYVALAAALVGQARISAPSEFRYPVVADEIADHAAEAITHWVIHPDNMDLTYLKEQTRLQCWTLKPAWPRPALS